MSLQPANLAKLFDTDNRTVVAMELPKSYCIDNNQATLFRLRRIRNYPTILWRCPAISLYLLTTACFH